MTSSEYSLGTAALRSSGGLMTKGMSVMIFIEIRGLFVIRASRGRIASDHYLCTALS